MIRSSGSVKLYRSAKERFFKSIVMRFFQNTFPQLFGPVIREKLADELATLVDRTYPPLSRLQPGQLLWNALDKHTRGDSPHRKFVPVVLSMITLTDIEQLENGTRPSIIAQNALARIITEAYEQGGILSMRDVGLLTFRTDAAVGRIRLQYEKEHDCILPHTGALHDMGSTITHKAAIVRKVIVEKKDPAVAAKECNHSQRAVDRYLKNYHRVKTLYEQNQDILFIHQVTGIAKHVVIQYVKIIQNEKHSPTKN